jgi:hypothetical protein
LHTPKKKGIASLVPFGTKGRRCHIFPKARVQDH